MRTRDDQIRRLLWQILGLNLGVAAAKVGTGLALGLLSLRADGFHSMLDGLNNLVALALMRLARQPPDDDHPYGHRKFEVLGSLALAGLMALLVARTAEDALAALAAPTTAVVEPAAIVVVLVTLVVNVTIATWEHRRGRALQSPLLVADAKHTASDVVVSLGVLVGLGVASLGVPRADAISALVVLVVVAGAAVQVVREAIDALADRALLPRDDVAACVTAVPGVRRVGSIRSRGLPGEVWVDLALGVDPALTVADAHAVAHAAEAAVQARWPEVREVVVHVEPAAAERAGPQ